MKNKTIYLMLVCMLLFAGQIYASSCQNEIKQQAKQLYRDDVRLTVSNIDSFVENRTNYVFYNKQRGLCEFWDTTRGDCTEKAFLKKYMIDSLKLQNIQTKIVHGWINGNNMIGKHDDLEINIKGKWKLININSIPDWKKKGNGRW